MKVIGSHLNGTRGYPNARYLYPASHKLPQHPRSKLLLSYMAAEIGSASLSRSKMSNLNCINSFQLNIAQQLVLKFDILSNSKAAKLSNYLGARLYYS